jgi:hypothetical protein
MIHIIKCIQQIVALEKDRFSDLSQERLPVINRGDSGQMTDP